MQSRAGPALPLARRAAWAAMLALLFMPGHIAPVHAQRQEQHQGQFRRPGIIGEDDRIVVSEEMQPQWNAVGRLNRGGRGHCTAVLIGPRDVLTAAHCLWDGRQRRWLEADELHFVPGYRGDSYAGHARGLTIKTAPSLELDAQGMPKRMRDDWAIIELDEDITAVAAVQPIPLAGHHVLSGNLRDLRLMRVGYSADRPHLPVLVADCSIKGLIENASVIVHDCDATYGDSGSPLVTKTKDGLRVLGVQSAFVTRGDDVFGIGVLMVKRVPPGVWGDLTDRATTN